ncbi:MAG: hypothetical protein L6R48_17595 [Planctomycetes bacterium]|nr:hypothetical protein [Planctomycetota bacterium]
MRPTVVLALVLALAAFAAAAAAEAPPAQPATAPAPLLVTLPAGAASAAVLTPEEAHYRELRGKVKAIRRAADQDPEIAALKKADEEARKTLEAASKAAQEASKAYQDKLQAFQAKQEGYADLKAEYDKAATARRASLGAASAAGVHPGPVVQVLPAGAASAAPAR